MVDAIRRTQPLITKGVCSYRFKPCPDYNIAGGKVGILGSLISFLNLVRFQNGATNKDE